MAGTVLATGDAAVSGTDNALSSGSLQSCEKPACQLNPVAPSGTKQRQSSQFTRSQILGKIRRESPNTIMCVEGSRMSDKHTCLHIPESKAASVRKVPPGGVPQAVSLTRSGLGSKETSSIWGFLQKILTRNANGLHDKYWQAEGPCSSWHLPFSSWLQEVSRGKNIQFVLSCLSLLRSPWRP